MLYRDSKEVFVLNESETEAGLAKIANYRYADKAATPGPEDQWS